MEGTEADLASMGLLIEGCRLVELRRYDEALRMLHPLVEQQAFSSSDLLGTLVLNVGICLIELGQLSEARRIFERAMRINFETEHEKWRATFLYELSLIAFKERDLPLALDLCLGSMALKMKQPVVYVAKGLGGHHEIDIGQLGNELIHLSAILQESEQPEEAIKVLSIVRMHCENVYNLDLLGGVFNELGLASFAARRYARGVGFFLDSLRVRRKTKNAPGLMKSAGNLWGCLQKYPDATSDPGVVRLLKNLQGEGVSEAHS